MASRGVRIPPKLAAHYHWVVAFCCFLLMFCNVGLPSTSFSVYQPYIVALPGIGDSAGSIIIGVRTFVSLLCMFAVVRYYQLLDCRIGSLIACLCAAVSMLLFGLASTFPAFCVAAAVGGAAYGFGGMVCTTLVINRWFSAKVGTAVGIAAVGSGVASIVIPVCAEWMIRNLSLSVSFWCEAVIALVIGVLTFMLLRDKPSQMGLEAYTEGDAPSEVATSEDAADENATASNSATPEGESAQPASASESATPAPASTGHKLTKRQYAIFIFGMALVGSVCVGAPAFLAVFLVQAGHDHAFAALALSVMGLVLTVGKFATGRIFDLLGDRRGTIISFTCFISGLVLICVGASGDGVLVWLGTILFAFGLAIGSTGIPIWSLHLSLPEERVATVRSFQLGYAAGGFVFTLLPGIIRDLTGTYLVSYVLFALMAALALAIVLVVYARVGKSGR